MAKRKRKEAIELNTEILVGFVNSFSFNDKDTEAALGGHPQEGRLYQLIKDDVYGYRLHIGAENNPSGMSGILLGQDLVGDYENRWSYNISVVNKENFLDFNMHSEDVEKLGNWFRTDNADLKEILAQPVKLVSKTEDGQVVERIPESDISSAINAMMLEDKRYGDFSDNLNTIMEKDKELFECIVDLVAYLSTTYSDKYESTQRPNIARDFLLGSTSGDTASFNAIKYLQRYCTVGFEKSNNPKDLYKAVHYVLFELQRRNRHA